MSIGTPAITGFSGFNSGLPIDDIVAKLIAAEHRPIDLMQQRQNVIKKKQSTYSSVQTKVSDLLSSIKKLTTRGFDGTSIFDGMTGTSSNKDIATATTTGTASPQTISLEVKSLPSQTKAASLAGVSNFSTATELSALGITTGNFTMFVNGVEKTIAVDASAGKTINDVLTAIQAAVPEITGASVVDGKIQLNYNVGAPPTITFGGGGDTSNFLGKTHLNTAVQNVGAGTFTSSQRISTIALGEVASGASNTSTAVVDGTFTINGVTFDSTGKSINQIISDINNSAAQVMASYNSGNDTFQLVSKDTGSTLISLGDSTTGGGTGNFLTAMGLINGGNTTTSQTAGKNTEFVLNGVTMYSTSAVVDETVTGLTGVTLNLKSAQPGTTISINVQKDTDSLKAAIKDVVEKYNSAIAYIDLQTDAKNKGTLAGESSLIGLRNQIRSLFTTNVGALSASAYDNLQSIGISTGAVSGSATATPMLKFDESKFDAALATDPNVVKKLFVGQDLVGGQDGSASDDNMEGILTQINHLLSDTTYTDTGGNTQYGALYNGGDNAKGLFAAYQASAGKRLEDLDKSISRAEDRLARREKTLRQQFLAMDKMVGLYQSQGNALNGLIAQLTANSKG
jgi:flagellar hook-associated protein 2